MDKIDIEQRFVVKAFEISGKFSFAVRLCPIEDEGDYAKCLVATREEVAGMPKDYSALQGVYKRTLGVTHFTFQQNSRGCLNYHEKYMHCLYHLVFFRANNSLEEAVKYQVEVTQSGIEYVLHEDSPNRYRQGENTD